MKTALQTEFRQNYLREIGIDLLTVSFVFFTPAISHLVRFPLYLAEPMRLMLILALAHSRKANAYLLALTLPLFSFAISAHPVFPKMILIGMELSLNVFLFYLLTGKRRNLFIAALLSILLSKLAYYLVKFALIRMCILDSELFSTPIWIQALTSLAFGLYLFVMMSPGDNRLSKGGLQ